MLNENNVIAVDVSDYSAADTLRETMNFYGITQRKMAGNLGISQPYLSDILNRRKFMSSATALKIEMATGIPADFLLRADTQYLLETEKKIFAQNMPIVKKFEWANQA